MTPSKRRRVGLGLITLVASLIFISLISTSCMVPPGTGVYVAGSNVQVPSIVGLNARGAAHRLRQFGLSSGEVRYTADRRVAQVVIAQNPEAGTQVASRSYVSYTLGVQGAPPAAQTIVPNLAGMTQDQARDTLTRVGLTAGPTNWTPSNQASGTVVSTQPAAGSRTAPGSAVSMVLSSGPQVRMIPVPSVVQLTLASAELQLTKYGLRVGTISKGFSETVPVNSVISQDPPAGGRVEEGGAVNLVIAAQRPMPKVRVPMLVQLTLRSAEEQLTAYGLRVGTVSKSFSETVPVDSIISQDPVAGTLVARGSAVNFVIAAHRPRPRVAVPMVVGLYKDQAILTLRQAGLRAGQINAVPSPSIPAGQVLSQSPAARAHVFRGSAVDLTLSDGPKKVIVPKLIGLTLAMATQVVRNAGLSVGTVGKQIVPGGTGLIVNQTPGAGYKVAEGTAVNLTLGVAPAGIPVPGVIGLTLDQARTALIQAGLQLGTITRRDPGPAAITNNTVLDQEPATGSYLPRRGRVNVTIAWHEPQSVRVPTLRGLKYRDAIEQLSSKRLKVGRVDHRTVSGPQVGKVIDQNPSANTRVWEGTAVNLVVGVKQREKLVLVPACLLLSEKKAVKSIKAKGLVPKVNKVAGIPRGRVIFQFPPPGTPVKKGSEVRIHVTR